jgi:hypothetical protein
MEEMPQDRDGSGSLGPDIAIKIGKCQMSTITK